MTDNREDLLFYQAYEEFYAMTARSDAFRAFCRDAFGQDFSQDGFSDIAQIDRILAYIPAGENVHILDIGCGNGKMLGYLQGKTGVFIHGFDYSGHAIADAKKRFPERADFREAIIGEINYPDSSFDVIISMDSMYFAKDMTAFVGQLKRWLKPGGVLFVGYQEGDVMPRTRDAGTTELAKALTANRMTYEVTDITGETYALLKGKRAAAIRHGKAIKKEGYGQWFDLLMIQTQCTEDSYEDFSQRMARYIFVIRK
jgi:2-polyprenyl-3-methyl-5-hydroxy-6-metoxy-1,4-benzoquinol methylase